MALLDGAVPRAAHRDEDVVLVLGREHLARVEAHADRRDVRAELERRRRELLARAVLAELGIERVALVAVGVAEVLSLARRHVQRVVRRVVAQPVASMVGEPELSGLRMKIEADRVAHALHIGLGDARLGIDTRNRRLEIRRHDDVARRADVVVELAVGSEREELPEMAWLVLWIEAVDDDLGRGRIVELVLDAVVARDAMVLGDVQRALAEDDTVRRLHALEQGLHFALAAAVDDRVNLFQLASADEHRALVAEGHGTRAGRALGPDLDLESGRDLELVDGKLLRRLAGDFDGEWVQSRFLLLRAAPLLPRGRSCRGRCLSLRERNAQHASQCR